MRVRFLAIIILMSICLGMSTTSPPTHAQQSNYLSEPFLTYYWTHEGIRTLGLVNSVLVHLNGYPSQYFEKGRLEDHRAEVSNPTWALMYGRLTVELMEQAPHMSINRTPVTYGDLYAYHAERVAAPEGFVGGAMPVVGGVFIPSDANLGSADGYIVPGYFWEYINRTDFFPGGWLHHIGLPLTNAFDVQVQKDNQERTIKMQAFERTVLTYDPLNSDGWQIERANIGTDAMHAIGQTPLLIEPQPPMWPKRIDIDLGSQRLYAYEGPFLIYDFPITSGRDDFPTPAGNYAIFDKRPIQDMRGTAGGETWYVPNVPHVMYFRNDGYAIHGTYWHNAFGTGARLSHGCVNLPLDAAAQLYEWSPIGTPVRVY